LIKSSSGVANWSFTAKPRFDLARTHGFPENKGMIHSQAMAPSEVATRITAVSDSSDKALFAGFEASVNALTDAFFSKEGT
jgi:hypothetical protein